MMKVTVSRNGAENQRWYGQGHKNGGKPKPEKRETGGENGMKVSDRLLAIIYKTGVETGRAFTRYWAYEPREDRLLREELLKRRMGKKL